MDWVAIVILSVIGAVLFFFLIPTLIMAGVLYSVLLVRNKPDKWVRGCSFPDDAEAVRMHEKGMEWAEKNQGRMREVSVRSGFMKHLKLAGEYYDFGKDRAVIIVPGRTETLYYSYYYAAPFADAGLNVLVIDNRAHGNSEGKISSLGYREYRDVIEWAKLLHNEFKNDKIFIEGICIGASTALFAAISQDCPDYVEGIIVEGMYKNFYESFLNHMKHDRPDIKRFPIMQEVMVHIFFISGANVVTDGPMWRIGRLKKPVLFLHSREDQYSLPPLTEIMYAKCNAPKRIVWFNKGLHSRIRINNEEKYDRAVREFLCDPPVQTDASHR